MNLSPRLSLLAVPLLLGAAAAWPLGEDHTTIPQAAGEVHAMLSGASPLTQAIETAQKEVGGLASSASVEADGSTRVQVYTPMKHFEVVVAGGAVKSKTDMPRFPGDPIVGDWTETASGLKYYDLRPGTGETPPGATAQVKVHYTGWLTNGAKFDSSVDRGEAIVFPLNGVIRGWTEGVGSMKVGGKRKLIIPYEMAYGAGGRPPVIPPKATLIFDVELLEVVK